MRWFRGFLLNALRKIDWDGGQGDGRVGERCGSDLITAPTSTARTDLDGFGNDPTDSKRDVANCNTGDDAEAGVKNQSENCAAESKNQAAYEKSMRILWDLVLQLVDAARTRERAVDTKIVARYALVTRLAHVRAGFWRVLRRAKLRSGIAEI